MAKYLNIGCGARFHADWINLDLVPNDPAVVACDIMKGLPYGSNEFDAVYHSHMLEHIDRNQAPLFLRECHRVLKKGGIIRVVVPDLERIAREYLKWLELAAQSVHSAEAKYDWIMLEFYDQFVRSRPGGNMLTHLKSGKDIDINYVRTRCGEGIAGLALVIAQAEGDPSSRSPNLVSRILALIAHARSAVQRLVLGADPRLLDQARFLRSGELHRWMYDRFSLPRLLTVSGFHHIRQVAAEESLIPLWREYGLDADAETGCPHKPDSLYVEAAKR
jgi:predicted SAM-dependent methyltransferase